MREIVYRGKYLTMSLEKIGDNVYERVTLRSGIRVIPVDESGKVLFIREFRTHEKKSRLKLVGGWMDKEGLTSLEVAKEELREEVSLRARKWKLFHTHNTANATVEERVDYFVAEDLEKMEKQSNPDSDVVEEIIFLDRDGFLEKLKQKEIIWDKDVAVLFMFWEKKRKGNC